MDNRQSQVGLCMIETLLASTVVGVMLLTLLSTQWSMQVHVRDIKRQQEINHARSNAFELLQACQTTRCRQVTCNAWLSSTAITPLIANGVCDCHDARCQVMIDWVKTDQPQSIWWL